MIFEKISEENVEELYRLVSNPVYSSNCGDIQKDYESFKKNTLALARGLRRNHVLLRDSQNVLFGTVFGYRFYPEDKTMCVTIFIKEGFYGTGIRSMKKFLEQIFLEFDLYKVYFHVYSYNENCLRIIKKLGIPQEGHLVGHRLLQGKRHDLFIFSLTKEYFSKLFLKLT